MEIAKNEAKTISFNEFFEKFEKVEKLEEKIKLVE